MGNDHGPIETTLLVPEATLIDGELSPVRVCMIDIGTNSFHALIVDVTPSGSYTVVDHIKEMVRLGEGGFIQHRLAESSIERAMKALRRIRMLADGWGVTRYLAFATSAVRESENGGKFVTRVRAEHDIGIRIIDGDLEAELIYKAVRRAKDLTEPCLLVDIGGGSTEFIVGTNEACLYRTSIKLGAARMTKQFVTSDPISRPELDALRAHCRSMLEPVYQSARQHRVRHVVGSSGTMQNLALSVIRAGGLPSAALFRHVIPAEDIHTMAERIISSNRQERSAIRGIDTGRIDQIVGGAALVALVIEDLGIEMVSVSSDALREGMVQHFIDENFREIQQLSRFTNIRRRSVYELAYRFKWDRNHVEHVVKMSLELFDACQQLHGLDGRARELLEYAAVLHDIGNLINYSSHHKHAIYLIKHAALRGFEPEEVDVIANIARYHRKSMPKKSHAEFARLSAENRDLVRKLASFLRMANGLDRSHFQNVTAIHVRLDDERLRLGIETRGDPQLELWAGRRSRDLFERTYDRKVEITPA